MSTRIFPEWFEAKGIRRHILCTELTIDRLSTERKAVLTSVTCSISALFSRASQSDRRTVTFSKMAISCHSVVLIASSEMDVSDEGVDVTMVRSHRLRVLESIANILFELEEERRRKAEKMCQSLYLTWRRVKPVSSEMRSSWRKGWISSGLSERSASSSSSWWKSNN